MFKTHALGLHSRIMKGDYNDNWTNLVATHDAFHQDLVQSGDYEEGGGSADPDAKIQALIAQTVEKKFGRLQATGDHGLGGRNNQSRNGNQETRACFECGEVGHIRRNCPKRNGNSTNPRHITPKQGESKDRMINGVPHKWCGNGG